MKREEDNQCCAGQDDTCIGFNPAVDQNPFDAHWTMCMCDQACMRNDDCCDDFYPTCIKMTTPITNIWVMADNILDGSGSGSFVWGDLYNYGCAGQGLFFDPHSTTLGKPVDEIDKALYKWKKCVQCALKHYNAKYEETFYVYDPESNSCGKI